MTKTVLVLTAALLAIVGVAHAADYLEKTDFQKSRAFSPAVVTDGGRIVWLAGQTATTDAEGKDIGGNFEAQTRGVFPLMDQKLRPPGGPRANLGTRTVFLKDAPQGARGGPAPRGHFPPGNSPGPAAHPLLTF